MSFFTTIYQQIKRKLFGSQALTKKEQISKISTISISFPKSKISILDVSKQKQQDTQKTETIPTTSTVKNTYPSGYILETNAFFHFEDYPEILECANQITNGGINFKIGKRRSGDVEKLVSDVSKIKQIVPARIDEYEWLH